LTESHSGVRGPGDLATPALGRSLIDLLGTIQHLESAGVDPLDQQAIDTTAPAGKLLFQLTAARRSTGCAPACWGGITGALHVPGSGGYEKEG